MSASSSSSLVRSAVLIVLVCALSVAVAGCSFPGKRHLQGTPNGMPPSLKYLPGDADGWLVADTSTARAQSASLAATFGSGEASPAMQFVRNVISSGEGGTWAGRAAGTAWYSVRHDVPSKLTFVDVRSRSKLEAALRRDGWKRTAKTIDAGHGHELTVWTRPGAGEAGSDARDHAVGVADDAVVGAATLADLSKLIADTRRYAVYKRISMVQYTIDALHASPLAVVVRSDQLRSDLRTLVQQSPALNEMTRWITDTSSVYALRDGWVGVVPGAHASDVKLIGAMDWARAATQIPEPKPVPPLDVHGLSGADWAVQIANPGAYLHDVVDAISDGGNQFATNEDDPKGTPKLGTVLDALDGTALVQGTGSTIIISTQVRHPKQTAKLANAAIELAGVTRFATATADGPNVVVGVNLAARGSGTPIILTGHNTHDAPRGLRSVIAATGKSPSKPVAWVYLAKSPCDATRPAAGWFRWDHTAQRLHFSFDVPVAQHGAGSAARCSKLFAS